MFASDSSHCHPADSVLDTNFLLSHAICPSICSSYKEDRERQDQARVSITSSLCRVPRPELIAATKFKTTKINFGGLFGLSTKITRYTVYKLLQTLTRTKSSFKAASFYMKVHMYTSNTLQTSKYFKTGNFVRFLSVKIRIYIIVRDRVQGLYAF